MQPTHEGDVANNLMMYGLMETACPMAYELIEHLNAMLDCIEVVPERMRRNLGHSAAFIAAENAMMVLAPALGRNRSHDPVHHAITEAVTAGDDLAGTLLRQAEVAAAIDEERLRETLAPENYTGLSAAIAREMADAARHAARDMQRRETAAANG